MLFRLKAQLCEYNFFYKAANNRYSAVNNHIAEGKYSASDSHIFLSNKFETMVSAPLAHFQVQMRFLHQHKGNDDSSFHN